MAKRVPRGIGEGCKRKAVAVQKERGRRVRARTAAHVGEVRTKVRTVVRDAVTPPVGRPDDHRPSVATAGQLTGRAAKSERAARLLTRPALAREAEGATTGSGRPR